jgi:hypothetical protein
MAVMGAWSKFGGEFLNPPTGPIFWLTGMSTWLSVALTLGAVQGPVLSSKKAVYLQRHPACWAPALRRGQPGLPVSGGLRIPPQT